MPGRPTHTMTERDLRLLSTDELLSLIQEDIRHLDSSRRARKREEPESKTARAQTGKRKKKSLDPSELLPREEAPEEVPEVLELHAVTCCNHTMGAFPAGARVRCPFCGTWHRAGDFPLAS